MTTGYSDGLSRVGEFYKSKYRPLEALRMFWMAHDKRNIDPLIEKLAFSLQDMMYSDDVNLKKDVISENEQEVKND